MALVRLAWLEAMLLGVTLTVARAEEPLVPDGEGIDVLDGAQWAALSGPRALASSGDGKVVATASEDGLIRLWEPASGRETRRIAVHGTVSALALSSDGKFLASGTRDGSTQLWETATGKSLASRPADGVPVGAIAVSPDGKALVFAGPRGNAQYWRYEEGANVARWADAPDTRALAWSPDGKFVALAQGEHKVVLMDAPVHKALRTLAVPEGSVTTLGVSPDGKIAAGTDTGLLAVFDVSSGQSHSVEAHSRPVSAIQFSGSLIATASPDGTVRLWNEANLQLIRKLKSDEACCTGVAISPTTALTMTSRGLARWDLASGLPLRSLQGQLNAVTALALAGPSARTVAIAAGDGVVRVIEGASGKVLARLGSTTDDAVAVSADEKAIAYADREHAIHVVAVGTWKDTQQLPPAEAPVTALAFSPDGKTLVAGVGAFGVRGWEIASARKLFELPSKGTVTQVVYASDGSVFVSGEGVGLVVRNGATGTELKRFTMGGVITSVAVSGDGKRVAAGVADGTVHLADMAAATESGKLQGNPPGPVQVALSHDGKSAMTAASDGSVRFWTLTGNKEIGKNEPRAGNPTAIALAPDDTIALVASDEGATTTWDFRAHAMVGVQRYGPDGWAAISAGKILRSDRGGFLLKANEKGELVSVPPRAAATALPELTADVTVAPVGQGPAVGKLSVKVTNSIRAAPGYWISVDPISLPNGMALLDRPVLDRLDAGASGTLNIPVSYVSPGSPLPQSVKIGLRLMHAGGAGPTVQATVPIRSARVESSLISMEGAKNTPVVRLEVRNSGDDATGALTVTPEFLDNGQVIGRAPVIELPSLAAQSKTVLAIAGPPDIVRQGVVLRLTASGAVWPTYAWVDSVPLHRSYPWLSIIAIVISIVASAAIILIVFVTRNPIVVQVSRDPMQLRHYDLTTLKRVERNLKRAFRLKEALAGANVTESRWARAVKAGSSADGAAAAFAESIGAKRSEQPLTGYDAWAAELPPLNLRFPRKTAIAVITGPSLEPGAAAALATALHADGEGPTVAIALDLTGDQTASAVLHNVAHMSFVVLTGADFRELLYADDPNVVMQRCIGTQRPLSELSPYQSAGGVEDEGLFFGREKELRTIADRTLHNFIVVAPRQMGKSSLLKAVQRRLSSRPEVECHLIELSDDDLGVRIARALNRPKPETADAFIELAAGTRRKPRVWLIDECDRFIVRDARTGYPISQAMRTLSEEGRAFFVLAGFWHLYAAVALNANNPLRNFGEMLRLEPLDRNAARDLATKPMEAMGISYEDPSLVEVILDETACRAHLITVVCRALVAGLDAESPVITAAAVNAALVQNPALWDEFKYWRREPLGRALVRLTLISGPGTRGELRERLKEYGLEVTNETYHATMDRLDLGYVLVPNAESRLECPVPVLRRFVELEDDLEAGLKNDIEEVLGVSPPPPPPPPPPETGENAVVDVAASEAPTGEAAPVPAEQAAEGEIPPPEEEAPAA